MLPRGVWAKIRTSQPSGAITSASSASFLVTTSTIDSADQTPLSA